MKYDITYTCGHTATIQLYGKTSEREAQIERMERTQLCPDCYRAAANAQAAEAADQRGLASLEGSPKQVAWATTIREKWIEWAEKSFVHGDQQVEAVVQYAGQKMTRASWWIDRRGDDELATAREIYRIMSAN